MSQFHLVRAGRIRRSRSKFFRRLLIEGLESRLPLAFAITSSDTSITLTGDASDDAVALSVSPSGHFRHDLPIAGNLVSDIDTDDSLEGEQSILATSVSRITIYGMAGNDTIDASAWVGAGMEVTGGAGNDTILGGSGNDVLEGGEFGDASGDDQLFGGSGNDTLLASAGASVLSGGDGYDWVSLNDQLVGVRHAIVTDTTVIREGIESMHDSIEAFMITGTSEDDTIDASALTTAMILANGRGGNDVIRGGSGNDDISCDIPGSMGDDIVEGGAGDDRLFVGGGVDAVDGGEGNDDVYIIQFSQVLISNTNYIIDGSESSHQGVERFDVSGTSGDDTINASAWTLGSLTAGGGDGNDWIHGGALRDELYGGAGDDTVLGGAGDDQLYGDEHLGGSGNDVVDGGEGDDWIYSDSGSNVLRGGEGDDRLNNPRASDVVLTDTLYVVDGLEQHHESIEAFHLTGTSDNDTFDASALTVGSLVADGLAGDDTILGGSGADVFFSNYPGDGNDVLFGGAGNDLFYYSEGSDAIDGGAGADEISMYSFSQVLITNTTYTANGTSGTHQGIESVVVTGTTGDDTIDASQWTTGTLSAFGIGGADWLHGGALGDQLHGGEGSDTLIGEDGDDQLYGDDHSVDFGNDVVNGGKGNDRIYSDLGSNNWLGGEGFDELVDWGVNNAVLNNTLYIADGTQRTHQGIEQFILLGTSGNDTIDARAFTYGSIIAAGMDGDDVIRGGAGNDILFGDDTYYYFGFRSGNDVLEGGGGNDLFGEVWGHDVIRGGDGNDEVTVGENTSVEISGSFDGGPGIDTVKAIAGTNTWNVTGAGAANLNGTANLALTTIESLMGGTGDDQFIFAAAGRLTGRVLGGDGVDTISFAAKTTAHTVNLQSNTATSTGGIGAIESFIGSSSAEITDVFVGPNSNTNWLVDGENSGSVTSTPTGSVSFSGFESLTGGKAADTFTFTSTGSLSRSLTGGTATGVIDTLDLSAKSGALDFRLDATSNTVPGSISGNYTGIEQITGNWVAGSTLSRVNNVATAWAVTPSGQIVVGGVSYNGVGAISGNPGTLADTLTGPAVAANWTIDSANGGILAIPGSTVSFNGVENVTGSSGIDTFTFGASGSLSGNLTGGSSTGGSDSLNLSAKTGALNFALNTTNSLPGTIGAYSGVEQITGNSVAGSSVMRVNNVATAWAVNPSGQIVVGGVSYNGVGAISGNPGTLADTLTGPALAANWTIDSANGGTLAIPGSTVSFSGVENVTGSSGIDTFTFGASGSLSGNLTGGSSTGGSDSLNLSAKTTALNFELNTTNSLPGTIGAYSGVEQITGNSVAGSSVTRVNNTTTAWTVNTAGQIVVSSVTYSGVGAIAGGPGADTITGPAIAGPGVSTWTINAANGGSLAIPGTVIGFTGVENLTGGTGSDEFVILPGGSLAGNLVGGTGTGINSLSYSAWTTGVTVNLAVSTSANATAITGRASNIQIVTGGSGNDMLTGQASAATILIGLAGNDTLTGGSQRDLFFGGTGADTIRGNGGEDLLISGTTAFDTNRAALLLLYAEWTSTRTFAQRTANIWGIGTGPRSNGSTFLNNNAADGITDTVFSDSDVDSLTGNASQDWFFALASEVTDLITTGATPDRRN